MLQSLRIGLATNSSSTHSVILHSKYNPERPENTGFDKDSSGYVSSFYVLTDPKDKLLLLAYGNNSISSNPSAHEKMEYMKTIRDLVKKHGIDTREFLQELGSFELSNDMDDIHCPEGVKLQTWLDFMLSDDVVIYGYHDSSESAHLAGKVDVHGVQFGHYYTTWKQDGDALVGMDKASGNKIRWSPSEYSKSTTPELVDVKLTDYCGYGCKFCYQGSTKEGRHARLEDLDKIFKQLRDMNCFEIAVGGGEPAHHPQFTEIMKMALDHGLTFNFTAYGTDWSKNPEVLKIMKNVEYGQKGFGVGISVHKPEDITKVTTAVTNLREAEVWNASVIAQTVIGATPMATTMKLLDACANASVPLILLGFKRTGRGADFKVSEAERDDVRKIVERAREYIQDDELIREQSLHLSVDTAFLDLYGDVLDEMGVPQILRTSPEGAFSMYVDAVEMTAGPSSYCDKSLMQPVGDLRAQFAQY